MRLPSLLVTVAALKHFMCKHVARMRAARDEARTLQSIAAFRARRLRVLTSLILEEKTELRTLYKYVFIEVTQIKIKVSWLILQGVE